MARRRRRRRPSVPLAFLLGVCAVLVFGGLLESAALLAALVLGLLIGGLAVVILSPRIRRARRVTRARVKPRRAPVNPPTGGPAGTPPPSWPARSAAPPPARPAGSCPQCGAAPVLLSIAGRGMGRRPGCVHGLAALRADLRASGESLARKVDPPAAAPERRP
jgi:hypothetical protein